MIGYVRDQHRVFLESNDEGDYDLQYQKSWHSKFRVHNIDSYPEYELPQKPSKRANVDLSQYLKKKTIEDEGFKKDSAIVALMKKATERDVKNKLNIFEDKKADEEQKKKVNDFE